MASPGMVPNPGLPMQASMYYGKTMVMYTAGDRVEAVVDGAPVGPNGRLFVVDVNDPTEVPWEAGRFMLEHLGYTGVVRVDEIDVRDERGRRTGTEYDIEKAQAESEAKLLAYDQLIWQQFISDMMEDYVSRRDGKNKAVPPPPERISRIIKRRGYKLLDYGIEPIGFEDPMDVSTKAMAEENKSLRTQVADLNSKFEAFMKMQAQGPQGGTNVTTQESDTGDDTGSGRSGPSGGASGGKRRGNR